MEITYVSLFVYAFGIYLISLAKANVVVFSVYDVLVELDTFGHVTISRTNITEWSYQPSKENSEAFLNIKEVRLLDKEAEVVKTIVFSSSETRQFQLSDFQSNQYTGVSANGRGMEVYSLGDAERALELRFYIFTEPGTIHPDVAPQKVRLGDVRVDVIVRDLDSICKDCSDVAALELVADVYGKEDEDIKTKLEEDNIDVISISKGAKFIFTDQLSLDGNWDTMPEGYPQLEAMDKSVEVTLRFPAFNEKAVFGLTVQPMKLGQTGNEVKALASVEKNKRQSGSNSGNILNCSMKILLLVLSAVCLIC